MLVAVGVLTAGPSTAQVEFNPATGFGRLREVVPSGLDGNEARYESAPQTAGTTVFEALYRPNARSGVGLRARYTFAETELAPVNAPVDFSTVLTNYVALSPVYHYRPRRWLSLDVALGYAFAFAPRAAGFDRFEPGIIVEPPAVEAADFGLAEVGVSATAGVATLRIGYLRSLQAERPGLAADQIARPSGYFRGVTATLGLRVGTAHRTYGRPPSVDSLLASVFAPLERRFPGWRVGFEANFFVGGPIGPEPAVQDGLAGGRARIAAAKRLNARWQLRAVAGWRRAAYSGSEVVDGDRRYYGTSRTHEVEFGGGAERVIWREFSLGADLTLSTRLDETWRSSSRREEAGPLPARADEPVPLASVVLLASPYLRYYAGERLTFDLRAELTATNPYGGQDDRRLAEPAPRSQRFGGAGAGFSYALLR